MYFPDGEVLGYTVYESDKVRESPVLGSDGKPILIIKKPNPVGFELKNKERNNY